MQYFVLLILLVLTAYLLGSIPSSVWIGRLFYGVDVREHGSKNAGATNTFRVLGKSAGIPVLVLDTLKGFLALKLAFLTDFAPGTAMFINYQLLLGGAALLGHIFPVYVGFKGGKGVATLLGIGLAIHFWATLASLGIFLLIFLIFHYVSLGSIIAGISFPLLVIFIFKTNILSLIIFSIVISLLLIITHQKNITRLINQEESKAYLFKRNGKQ